MIIEDPQNEADYSGSTGMATVARDTDKLHLGAVKWKCKLSEVDSVFLSRINQDMVCHKARNRHHSGGYGDSHVLACLLMDIVMGDN